MVVQRPGRPNFNFPKKNFTADLFAFVRPFIHQQNTQEEALLKLRAKADVL